MALSKEQKEALNEHFRNKDVYDPSKAKEQEVSTFMPKGMADGGPVVGAEDPAHEEAQAADAESEAAANQVNAGEDTAPDTGYDEAIAGLKPSLGQRLGQGAFQGLAGLADSIQAGVARAGPGQWQKNIMETQQQQKQNLINALNAKYGHGLEKARLGLTARGQESENTRAANALKSDELRAANAQAGENERAAQSRQAEKERTAAELAVRSKEAEAGRAQSGLEAAAKLPVPHWWNPATWGERGEKLQKIQDTLMSQGQPQLAHITSKAQFDALPSGSKFVDDTGKVKVKH